MDIDESAVSTSGGAVVNGGVNIANGDFVGRDKIEIQTAIQRQDVKSLIQIFVTDPSALTTTLRMLSTQHNLNANALTVLATKAASAQSSQDIAVVQMAQQQLVANGAAISPEDAYHLGILAAYRRDYDNALAYLQQAIQAEPGYVDAFKTIAWLQQALADNDQSRHDYPSAFNRLKAARAAAKETSPTDADSLALRGYIAKSLAQVVAATHCEPDQEKYYREAQDLFETAAKLAPENASVLNGLGNVQYAQGDLDGAIDAYRLAIKLSPHYVAAHHDLALAYEAKIQADPARSTQWYQKALAAWREAYHLAPGDPGFTAQKVLSIGQHILRLENQSERMKP